MSLVEWTNRKEFPNSHKFSYSPLSSISNLSSTFSSTTGIGKKTLQITLPEDFGAQVSSDGRIQRLLPNTPAHSSAVVQVGDIVRIETCPHRHSSNFVTLHLTYSQIQVEARPNVPFIIEIGNRSHTALGMALTDSWRRQIQIASIQRGSLADRCGFLRPGDTLTMVHVKSGTEIESIPCSFYTSCQLAHILRQLTTTALSVTLSIIPGTCQGNLMRSKTLLPTERPESVEFKWDDEGIENVGLSRKNLQGETGERSPAPAETVLLFCLWKDSSFDDWGFSVLDEEPEGQQSKGPTIVQEIRRGGPAYLVGLQPGDKILKINDRDVSTYESTILVPILASLQDALNLVVLRP